MYRSAYNSDIQRVTATFHETTPESFFHCFQYPRLEIRRVLPGLALRESRLQVSSSTLRVIGLFMCTLQKPFLFHAAAGHRWSASSASVPLQAKFHSSEVANIASSPESQATSSSTSALSSSESLSSSSDSATCPPDARSRPPSLTG